MYRKNYKERGFKLKISDNTSRTPRIRGGCGVCKVYLCRKGECVRRFHEGITTIDSIE